MYGIVHTGEVATSIFPTVQLATEALRNSDPGARVIECDNRGNPVVRTEVKEANPDA